MNGASDIVWALEDLGAATAKFWLLCVALPLVVIVLACVVAVALVGREFWLARNSDHGDV